MCGICGIVQLPQAGPVDRRLVGRMVASMRHRGPNGDGLWVAEHGHVALGHRRLAIVDLSPAGRQPMGNADGSIQVTFNGEIYNYRELRCGLETKGYVFRSQTDTEVLVYLYEELGDAMIDKLDGDFAFAIWDERRQRLLAARDRAGVKPFYYIRLRDRLLFASEIKALLQHPAVPADVDPEALYHYLTYLVVPPPKTLLRDVRKLPAAGTLTVNLEEDELRIEERCYWRPLPGQCQLRGGELDEQFEELFEQAVEKRLMGDVPVGVLFSGGVDSTLNAASFGRRIAPRQVRTFTVGVSGTKLFRDESRHAQEVASRLGTEHHEVIITERDMLSAMQTIAAQQDEPLADPVCVPLYFVTRLARETGTLVLHAGEGADEIFCGYEKYSPLMRYERYWRTLSHLPSIVPRTAGRWLSSSDRPRWRKAGDALSRLGRGQRLFMSSSVACFEGEKSRLLSPDFQHRTAHLDSFDVAAEIYRELAADCPEATFQQQIAYHELRLRLPELLLMRVDKMSMLNSVEVRVPFLDRRLVDFALSAPQSFKVRDGVAKEPLKRLAARYVPHDWVYRKKTGFGAPIQEWFSAGLGRQMRRQMHIEREELSEFFDVDALDCRLTQPIPSVNDAFQLWTVFNFMQWRQSFNRTALGAAA